MSTYIDPYGDSAIYLSTINRYHFIPDSTYMDHIKSMDKTDECTKASMIIRVGKWRSSS